MRFIFQHNTLYGLHTTVFSSYWSKKSLTADMTSSWERSSQWTFQLTRVEEEEEEEQQQQQQQQERIKEKKKANFPSRQWTSVT